MPKYKIENYTDPVSVAEQDVTAFLEKYPNAVLIEEQIEEVAQDTTSADLLDPTTFQKDAAADADVVSQPMTASQAEYVEPEDTELAPVDTSLDSQDLANEDFTLEQFKLMTPKEKNALSYSEKQRLSREKNNEKNNVLDEIESEASKKFKSGALRVGSNLAQIPAFINRLKMTTLIGIAGPAFKKDIDKFKELDSATQDRIAQAIGSFSGGPIGDIGVAGSIGLEAAENLKNKAKKIEETLTKYDNTIGQDFIEGNVSQAVSRTFNEVIGTIPSIAQAFVPYVGISSIVAGSAADYSTEALAEGKKLDAANMIAATATGFSEGLLELTTKKIGKGLFKSLAGKSKDVVSKTLKEAALQTAKEAGQEGLSESTTEVLNRSIDALYKNKGDEWDNIWPELADVFIIGAAAGGGMSGTGNTGSIINKAVQVNSVNRTLQENNSQSVLDSFEKDPISKETINIAKNKYSGNILDIELKNKVSNGDISVEESKSIKQKFDVTRKNIQLTSDLKINENLIQETIGLLDERESLSSEIAKAKGNKSLVQTQQSRLNDIDSRLSEISAENKLSITTKTVEKLAKDVKGLTVKNLDNADAIVDFIEKNNIDIDSKKASNEQGFIYQNPKTGEQTIVINKEIAAKDRAVNVAAHEFLHGLIFQTVKNSPETQIALGKSLNEYINKIDVNQIKDSNFAKRLESYKDMDEATQSEEVLTLFSDAIATGDIQFNESVFTKIGDVIRRTLQNLGVKVKFNNGKDVYNFVKDYNKSIEKGKLTKAQKAVGKKGAEGTLVLEKTVEAEPGIKESKQLTPEQDTQLRSDVAEIKKEASESEALAKKFNKDFIKGAKQTRLENKVLNEIKPVVERVITNRTKALYDPIVEDAKKLVSREMFQESMRSDIETMVLNEFTGKQDIEKFIVNRGFLRANNLAERLGIKNAEEGIDKNLDTAKTILVEETEQPKADRPKYRNILKSNVLPTETIAKVKDKVLKTVRTLKSKLNTKVSINKTVTPLIAEIKENMGKQADIDFKKAMGGKKDGQLKRFLIKNKKAILENMTTTWLVKAMPGAIQKQVDGNFISDWQGKKIDREKTTTQQAGRTSGAEIVRRLPNAFKNLDDKTYLGYVVDESGAPIRGRKESLAKAMAEELSFDIFAAEIQDENSEISRAFESNQEALGEVLADNFVQQITRDAERGTVKFSMSAKSKSNIKDLLEGENKNLNKNSIEYRLNTNLLNKLDKIKTIEDLLKTLYSETVNTYRITNMANRARIKILNLIARNTDNTISFEEIFNTFQKAVTRDLWKYEKQVIGFGYSLTNLENNIKKDRVKAIKDWFKYDSRVIRTQKIQNITRNLDAFNYLKSKEIALDGFEVTFNDNKTRSYIEYKGERLFNLTDVTDIKKNFELKADIINKEANESTNYMLNTIEKGVKNNDIGALNGWIALMYEDQRGPIRKSSKTGKFVKNYKELKLADLILEHETEAYYIYKAYQDLVNNYSEAKVQETKNFLDKAFVNLVSKEIDADLKRT